MMFIGICGKKRCGKTTLGNALASRFGLKHLSFAEPIREFTCSLLDFSEEELEARKEDPVAWLDGVTPRHIMQELGTAWGRELIHDELWVRRVMAQAQKCEYRAVISDVRFQNEAETIIKAGGMILRIVRPLVQQVEDLHISEAQLPDEYVHGVVANIGTVQDMVDIAVACIEDTQAIRIAPPGQGDEE